MLASEQPSQETDDFTKSFFSNDKITIFNQDILKTKAIQRNSIDLMVTSPPYGVDIKYATYDDNIPYEKYLEFTKKWLTRCFELSKPDGRFCLNIPLDKNKGGQQSVYADFIGIAKEVGLKYHSTIIWNESNISRRTAWGSWMSASAPFVIAPVETIAILYKERWTKAAKGESDITRDEFMQWTNGYWNPKEEEIQPEGNPVWEFSGESKKKVGHPAPFPVELPRRCIKLFSYVGDTVLDPFMGSGSTLVACLQTHRKGVGVDVSENYCELALQRLRSYGLLEEKLETFAGTQTISRSNPQSQ